MPTDLEHPLSAANQLQLQTGQLLESVGQRYGLPADRLLLANRMALGPFENGLALAWASTNGGCHPLECLSRANLPAGIATLLGPAFTDPVDVFALSPTLKPAELLYTIGFALPLDGEVSVTADFIVL